MTYRIKVNLMRLMKSSSSDFSFGRPHTKSIYDSSIAIPHSCDERERLSDKTLDAPANQVELIHKNTIFHEATQLNDNIAIWI